MEKIQELVWGYTISKAIRNQQIIRAIATWKGVLIGT